MKEELPPAEREVLENRWIEASDTLRRLPPFKGPKEYGNGWPEIVRDWADANMRESGRDVKEWAWNLRKEPPTAAAITRLEEVYEWEKRFIRTMGWPAHRPGSPLKCLRWWANCVLGGRTFTSVCRRNGVVARTAYRRKDAALLSVHRGLIANGLTATPSLVDYVSQSSQIDEHKPLDWEISR